VQASKACTAYSHSVNASNANCDNVMDSHKNIVNVNKAITTSTMVDENSEISCYGCLVLLRESGSVEEISKVPVSARPIWKK